MGTNYYAKSHKATCDCCKHTNEEDILHIGKSSWGWIFRFRGYDRGYKPYIKSYDGWKAYLNNKDIYIEDEYNDVILKKDFFKMIETNQKDPDNRVHDMLYEESNWVDNEGYSFTRSEFS